MEKSLYRYIWKYSARQQVTILLITLMSFPILYITLLLPKQIVNDAIQGTNFPRDIFGFELGQVNYLLALCFAFLALVVVNNMVKYTLNVYKGLTGERMLRRMRFDLFERVLRFRLPHFRKVSSGEIIPMITAEVEPLGGFIGDAIATPAFQGGTLLVYIVFIFLQDPWLGAAAVVLYPVQGYIIPKLQARVIKLARERVKNVRHMADRIGESITGVAEIHANDTSAYHLADLSDRLFTNFKIRYEIFKRKYMIKFVNNFMNQLTPFFFYSVGGWLVIEGDISFGALVAVLAAYKDLAGPWKELLSYYQEQADVQVKYSTVIENFDPPDLYPRERLIDDSGAEKALSGDVTLENLNFTAGTTGQEVKDINLTIPEGKAVAIVGGDNSGRSELMQLAAGLVVADSGTARIGGENLKDQPESVLGRSISYVSPAPHIFTDTIRGNLHYGLKHRPVADAPDGPGDDEKRRVHEALMTANSDFDVRDHWVDLTAAGVDDEDALDEEGMRLLEEVGMGGDVYRMGLQAHIDPAREKELCERVLAVREAFSEQVTADPELNGLVDLWDMDRLNPSATIAENLLYALPADPAFAHDRIPEDPPVMDLLKRAELDDDFVDIGVTIAETMVELFSDVKSDGSLLGAFSFITTDELPEFETTVRKAKADGIGKLSAGQRTALSGLAFKLVPARHRLGVIDDKREAKIVAARRLFREMATDDYVLFDRKEYIAPLTIEDNLIFGKPRLDRRGSRERIDELIGEVVTRMELRRPIATSGLDFHVGVAGSSLSAGQRRKIGLIRALLKQPQITILNGIADGTGLEDRQLLDVVRRSTEGKTLIFGTSTLESAKDFERVVLLKDGRVVAEGSYAEVSNAHAQ